MNIVHIPLLLEIVLGSVQRYETRSYTIKFKFLKYPKLGLILCPNFEKKTGDKVRSQDENNTQKPFLKKGTKLSISPKLVLKGVSAFTLSLGFCLTCPSLLVISIILIQIVCACVYLTRQFCILIHRQNWPLHFLWQNRWRSG